MPRENIGRFLAKTLQCDMNWLYGKDSEFVETVKHYSIEDPNQSDLEEKE